MTSHAAQELDKQWQTDPRWKGVRRTYSAADVVWLRGSVQIEQTLARLGAEKLWKLVNSEPYVNCLGALTGGQAGLAELTPQAAARTLTPPGDLDAAAAGGCPAGRPLAPGS